jgi:hypothetical protein
MSRLLVTTATTVAIALWVYGPVIAYWEALTWAR